MKFKEGCQIVSLNILHFAITAILPIYNIEFFKIAPYPLFVTFLQLFLSIPLAAFVAWAQLGFPHNFRWLIPPRDIIWQVIYTSTLYGVMVSINNFGLFVSDVDFSTLFRLAGVIINGIFAFFFLRERVTIIGALSMVVVLIGVMILSMSFNFDTAKMPSGLQIFIQVICLFLSAISAITSKKMLNYIKDSERTIPMLTIVAWRYTIAIFPIFIISIVMEQHAWLNMRKVMTPAAIGFTAIGIVLSQSFQLLGLYITKLQRVITVIVIGQLKFLPTLIISHFLYGKTQWTVKQIIGALLLIAGATTYSLSRAFCDDDSQQPNTAQLPLDQSEMPNEVSDDEIKIDVSLESDLELEEVENSSLPTDKPVRSSS